MVLQLGDWATGKGQRATGKGQEATGNGLLPTGQCPAIHSSLKHTYVCTIRRIAYITGQQEQQQEQEQEQEQQVAAAIRSGQTNHANEPH
ncbi:hypothetical protein AWZ03_004703 [Drosophila navojoa]|uniref:Uncharacterized protein n=1 Tax=Drosophila navojoa TaxID=7232 RepID=A0A484BL85_DRONA|nr:hypothetical protein AWZ03_004703 [Drosophila navojoa]